MNRSLEVDGYNLLVMIFCYLYKKSEVLIRIECAFKAHRKTLLGHKLLQYATEPAEALFFNSMQFKLRI